MGPIKEAREVGSEERREEGIEEGREKPGGRPAAWRPRLWASAPGGRPARPGGRPPFWRPARPASPACPAWA